MTAKLQLFGTEISQPARAVKWFCEIADIPYESIQINVAAARKKRADYIKNINPNGRIPAIKDTNGLVLYEGAAILQYLCNRYGKTDLYPTDLKSRAKIDEYLHWHHENTRMITSSYVGPIMRVDVPFERWIKGTDLLRRRKALRVTLDIIENKRLGKQKYIAGDSLSIADIFCYEELVQLDVWNLLDEGANLGFDADGSRYMKRKYPNIYQWLLRMRGLPKHDEVHAVMVSDIILKHVAYRSTAFAKAIKQHQAKL